MNENIRSALVSLSTFRVAAKDRWFNYATKGASLAKPDQAFSDVAMPIHSRFPGVAAQGVFREVLNSFMTVVTLGGSFGVNKRNVEESLNRDLHVVAGHGQVRC